MKANRKFIDGEEAVSAVIGVILMVAITVAIAATVYVYVSGMIGGGQEAAPSISFNKKDQSSTNSLTVVSADPTTLDWGDLEVNASDGSPCSKPGGTGDKVKAGEAITCPTTECTVSIRHIPTNTLIGTYDFQASVS
jgi:flagellin-like protein